MEAIRIFLGFATYMNFIVFQMDVKSAFLNGKLKEEVYVKQPTGFESSEFPDYAWKLDKALYGLKQAPKAWTSRLCDYAVSNGFRIRGVSNGLNTAYCLSWIWRIGLVSFVVIGECRHGYAVSSLMDTAYW
ncbi:retrovirus-related pol polyprotein from transposon TNT 1-94 [Tanacetum coccineum]